MQTSLPMQTSSQKIGEISSLGMCVCEKFDGGKADSLMAKVHFLEMSEEAFDMTRIF